MSPRIADLRGGAEAIIQKVFRDCPSWGFKDPRSCVTFPFWRAVVKCPIRAVLVIRNPLDAALSLFMRNNLPVSEGANLWLVHIKEALRSSRGLPRHFVVYDEMLSNFQQEFQLLAQFAGRNIDSRVRGEARIFTEPTLRHHRNTQVDLNAHPEIPVAVREAYTTIRLLAKSSRKGEDLHTLHI